MITLRVEPLTKEVEELLERRTQRARERVVVVEEERVHWVAEFPIGEERFAVPLEVLRGAVPLGMVTPVPLSSPEVIGILRFQGEIIAALSLASLLGVRGWREDPKVLLVLERAGGQKVALDCEQIPKPISLPAAAIETARATGGAYVEVTTADLRQVNLIDVNRLLARRREGS